MDFVFQLLNYKKEEIEQQALKQLESAGVNPFVLKSNPFLEQSNGGAVNPLSLVTFPIATCYLPVIIIGIIFKRFVTMRTVMKSSHASKLQEASTTNVLFDTKHQEIVG